MGVKKKRRKYKDILYTAGRRELEAAVVVVRSRVVLIFRPLSLTPLMELSTLVAECIFGACVFFWPMTEAIVASPEPLARLRCLMTSSLLEVLDPAREWVEDVGDDGV